MKYWRNFSGGLIVFSAKNYTFHHNLYRIDVPLSFSPTMRSTEHSAGVSMEFGSSVCFEIGRELCEVVDVVACLDSCCLLDGFHILYAVLVDDKREFVDSYNREWSLRFQRKLVVCRCINSIGAILRSGGKRRFFNTNKLFRWKFGNVSGVVVTFLLVSTLCWC